MRSKSAEETTGTFSKMIQKQKPQQVWTDKRTEFKGAFKNLCDQEGIETYTTQSETKSAYAGKNIRLLKNIYKHWEHKWTYHYINKLRQFVDTINSRVNRVTKLAPNKVTISGTISCSRKIGRKTSISSWRHSSDSQARFTFQKRYK